MTETKFENKCVYTLSMYHKLKRTLLKSLMTTGYVIIAIGFICFGYGKFRDWTLVWMVGLLVALFALYRVVVSPFILALRDAKRDKILYKQPMVSLVNFYDDHFLAVNAISRGKTSIEYKDVKFIKENSRSFIIGMEKNLVILVDKKGFSKGSASEFKTFIKEKCEGAKADI